MQNAMQVLRWSMVVLWLASAALPLLPKVQVQALNELVQFGFHQAWLLPLMYASMLLDACCAVLAGCVRRAWVWRAWVWPLQMAVVLIYSVLLSISHTSLWLDPFGALLKNTPILAAMAVLWVDEKGRMRS